jgi:hypothetical protein
MTTCQLAPLVSKGVLVKAVCGMSLPWGGEISG